MAKRPAKAGSGRGLAPVADVAPGAQSSPGVRALRPAAGHRATRRRTPHPSRDQSQDPEHAAVGGLAWLPYLIVLAGAVAGLFAVWRGSKYAAFGTGLLGGSMLVAALARLALPERYAALLASRRKASDVLAFAALGAAVLAAALTLP
jgi:Protein of unknown function (DUF3017)